MTTGFGLQTHFNALLDTPTLEAIRDFHFTWARMDCMACTAATMLEMIAQVRAVGLTPLPIVYDLDRLGALASMDVEWGNEPDGDILPSTYRPQLDAACALALTRGLRLWAPAISNLDRDSLRWLAQVRGAGWPAGLHGVSVHRYGDGTFDYSHPPFETREEEVERLKTYLDGRPYLVTEFGFPTAAGGAGRRARSIDAEAQQAALITEEWAFWIAQGCAVPFLYQLNDGLPGTGEGYGIRRLAPDGQLNGWKPSALTVPTDTPAPAFPLAGVLPNTLFYRSDLVATGRPDEYGLRWPVGAATILSPKANGAHELRDVAYLGGADETCRVEAGLVYFPAVGCAWPFLEN